MKSKAIIKKKRWIILGIALAMILPCFLSNLANKILMDTLRKQPEYAFKCCFGFQLSAGAEIVTVGVMKNMWWQHPIYAFEILLPEEEYDELMKGLNQFVYEIVKDKPYYNGVLWDEVSIEQRELYSFFDNSRWRYLDWKDQEPKSIVYDAESANDVGLDITKSMHQTHLLIAKEDDGSLRVYLCTD